MFLLCNLNFYSSFARHLGSDCLACVVFSCRNPGSTPEWLGNVIIAAFISAVICLTLVYLLSYVHLSGISLLNLFPLLHVMLTYLVVWVLLSSVLAN